jgi:hypothetical protein
MMETPFFHRVEVRNGGFDLQGSRDSTTHRMCGGENVLLLGIAGTCPIILTEY